MKLFRLTILFYVLVCIACQSDKNETTFPLKGTQWKLVGIVNSVTGEQTILDPTDCESCYTLVFDSNTTATVQSITSTFKLDLLHLNPYVNFEDILKYEEYNGKNYEINSFYRRVSAAKSFMANSKELRLYGLDGNYLLFESFKNN